MKKNIELSLKEARELFGQNPTMDKMLLANFSKEELEDKLPSKWRDLRIINGFVIEDGKTINKCGTTHTNYINTCWDSNKHVFASEKEAKSALAQAQLSQLMKVYRNGWKPDWSDNGNRYSIKCTHNNLSVQYNQSFHYYLTFQTEELADQFLENFRDLIEDYFMIEK